MVAAWPEAGGSRSDSVVGELLGQGSPWFGATFRPTPTPSAP